VSPRESSSVRASPPRASPETPNSYKRWRPRHP
jgi:hypothetical protein